MLDDIHHYSEHELNQFIRQNRLQYNDAYQIHKRMKSLLEAKLKTIKQKYRPKNSATRSERLSLVDPEHIKYLQEMSVIFKRRIESKIAYETATLFKSALKSQKSSPYIKRTSSC